ncbi:hypothetical protein GCM10027267_09060 [Paramicrobacterium agarici]
MGAAAAQTRRAQLPVLALNAFGSNAGARRLYEREGYVATETLWSAKVSKPVDYTRPER